MSFSRLVFGAFAPVTVLLAAACDDPLALPPAIDGNFIDTVSINALQGTPITAPSGYQLIFRSPARTDQGDPFDIAFDLDSADRALILPPGALGLDGRAGVQFADVPFADLDFAPFEDYVSDSALVVAEDSVFIVRSQADFLGCPFFIGALPRYGKFRVLEVNRQDRTITLEALVNVNCGYRALDLGLPTR